MKNILKTVWALAGLAVASEAAANITFYEHDRFQRAIFHHEPADQQCRTLWIQ